MTQNERERGFVVPMSETTSVGDIAEYARKAEDLGYTEVSMGETTGWNVVPVLAPVAEATDEIGITQHVLSPYSRSPALIAQTAVTLADISDGRYRLGVGASSPELAERWHGRDFERPLRHVAETVEIVKEIGTGERVEYDGEVFGVGNMKLTCPAPDERVEVDVAALGPKTTKMAGELADGWNPQLLPKQGLRERMEAFEDGLNESGRTHDDVTVAPVVRCCVASESEQARQQARMMLAFMIARYGPFYRRAVAEFGWEDAVEEIREEWDEGGVAEASQEVPDGLIDDVAAVGTPDEARSRLEEFESIDGVDYVRVAFAGMLGDEQKETTMKELAP
ncbi:MAG: TIGR04024 family LLM class F420-dependent oxidoreductase [Halobacteriales archaeon]|nr:TIGR04024 family LLM class F420-dependent oxidoreductase [Halobacteriales archaeon]